MEASTAGSNPGMDYCLAEMASAYYLQPRHGWATSGTDLPCPGYQALVSLATVLVRCSSFLLVSMNFDSMSHRALAVVVKKEGIQIVWMCLIRSKMEVPFCMAVTPDLVLSPHALLVDAAETGRGHPGMAMELASWMRLEVKWVVAHYSGEDSLVRESASLACEFSRVRQWANLGSRAFVETSPRLASHTGIPRPF